MELDPEIRVAFELKSKEVYRALISLTEPEDIKREFCNNVHLLTYVDYKIVTSYFGVKYSIEFNSYENYFGAGPSISNAPDEITVPQANAAIPGPRPGPE